MNYQNFIDSQKNKNNFTLLEFHGRPVLVRPLKKYEKHEKCPDCGGDAMMAVYEVGGVTPSRWYYCGQCEIGG